jgi:alcohol dehydrogenase
VDSNKDYNPVEIIKTDNFLNVLKDHISTGTLIVTSPGFIKRGVIAEIQKINSDVVIFSDVKPNPELEAIDIAVTELRKSNITNIIALGGGSVIDTAKGFALALKTDISNPLRVNLLESESQSWDSKLPLIAVPTTSGTGSEVTPFATIWDTETNKKYSLNTNFLFPDIAILDASLTQTLPKTLTLYTSLDAISHALESLWNNNRTTESEAVALKALRLANKSFLPLMGDLANIDLRSDLQVASTYAGLAISHTRTAIAHSISYPMTLAYDMPHGLACSFTLPKILKLHLKNISNKEEIEVLTKTLKILETIDFKSEVESYTLGDDYSKLKDQMFTKERAGNFKYSIDSIEEYL